MTMTAFASDLMSVEPQATTMTTADNMMASGIKAESELHIYPNPASRGISELMISGLEGINNGFESKIEIQRITGEIVYSVKFNCGFDCTEYSMPLSDEFTPGVYLVNVITNGRKFSKRLFIKLE
jgi:hypothetical protein